MVNECRHTYQAGCEECESFALGIKIEMLLKKCRELSLPVD